MYTWAADASNYNTRCEDEESCEFYFDSYALNIRYTDVGSTRVVDNDDDLVLCVQLNNEENPTGQDFTCSNSMNYVYTLPFDFDFSTTDFMWGDDTRVAPTNYGWMRDLTDTGLATGFGDFLFNDWTDSNTGIGAAQFIYYCGTENNGEVDANRWEPAVVVNAVLCDYEQVSDDQCWS